MSTAPLPTTLTFLSQLPTHDLGSKWRFIGCVRSYNSSNGVLVLAHAYPPSSSQSVQALVDVNLLLEHTKREDLEIGAWLNIIGYVGEKRRTEKSRQDRKDSRKTKLEDIADEVQASIEVCVQAVVLWNAGAIKIASYEGNLEQRLRLKDK